MVKTSTLKKIVNTSLIIIAIGIIATTETIVIGEATPETTIVRYIIGLLAVTSMILYFIIWRREKKAKKK